MNKSTVMKVQTDYTLVFHFSTLFWRVLNIRLVFYAL